MGIERNVEKMLIHTQMALYSICIGTWADLEVYVVLETTHTHIYKEGFRMDSFEQASGETRERERASKREREAAVVVVVVVARAAGGGAWLLV